MSSRTVCGFEDYCVGPLCGLLACNKIMHYWNVIVFGSHATSMQTMFLAMYNMFICNMCCVVWILVRAYMMNDCCYSLSLPLSFSLSLSLVDAIPSLSDCSEVSGALLFLLMHPPLQQLRQLSKVFDHCHITYCCFLCVQWAIYKPLLSQKSSHSTELIARLCLN